MPQCITVETDAQVKPSPCFRSGREAARNAISSLVEAGVLSQNARNRKSNIYTAEDVLDAFTLFERAAVTRDHNTARANPARPAPLNPNVEHRAAERRDNRGAHRDEKRKRSGSQSAPQHAGPPHRAR